jgi:putative oxidoreductase
MKKYLPTVARYLLGLIYFGAGASGLAMLGQPPPEGTPEAIVTYFNSMMATVYFIPLLKVTETTCGLLLLINRGPALALVILAPITINIFMVHTFLTPGIQNLILPIVMVALHITAATKYWPHYKLLFSKGT